LCFTINLSARRLSVPDFAGRVKKILDQTGIHPQCVSLEITESKLIYNLGWTLVAEGIETRDQLAMLQSMDCNKVQGFYFSKPMPTAEAETYIGEIVSKTIDNHDCTGSISQNRFFGESGPSSSAGDPIPVSEVEELGFVTDGQIIEPGMLPRCWFGPSNGPEFFRATVTVPVMRY
jgi:hypothetical protein